jgi:hypothetical protein
MTARALLWAVLALAMTAARAETVYVVEQVVVGVVSAPGGAGERVTTVKSGDRLELLERQGDESHVRLASGTEGWIRSPYLSAEPPLHQRLSERTAEVEKLKQDVARLEAELATARQDSGSPAGAHSASGAQQASANMTRRPDGAPAPAGGGAPAVHEASIFLRSPQDGSELPWMWILVMGLVMLAAGFALGWRVLDRRIRRKYGGLRIY